MTNNFQIIILDTRKSDIEEKVKFTKQLNRRPVLEDFQLPLKYRRRPLDEAEINVINVNNFILLGIRNISGAHKLI